MHACMNALAVLTALSRLVFRYPEYSYKQVQYAKKKVEDIFLHAQGRGGARNFLFSAEQEFLFEVKCFMAHVVLFFCLRLLLLCVCVIVMSVGIVRLVQEGSRIQTSGVPMVAGRKVRHPSQSKQNSQEAS